MESLTSNGNVFQSLGAAQVNDLSPSVTLDVDVDSGTRDFRLDLSRLFYLCKVSSVAPPGGGYSFIWAIQVCAATEGMVFRVFWS